MLRRRSGVRQSGPSLSTSGEADGARSSDRVEAMFNQVPHALDSEARRVGRGRDLRSERRLGRRGLERPPAFRPSVPPRGEGRREGPDRAGRQGRAGRPRQGGCGCQHGARRRGRAAAAPRCRRRPPTDPAASSPRRGTRARASAAAATARRCRRRPRATPYPAPTPPWAATAHQRTRSACRARGSARRAARPPGGRSGEIGAKGYRGRAVLEGRA